MAILHYKSKGASESMKTGKSKIAVLAIITAVAFTLLTAACTPKQKEPQKLEVVIKPTEQPQQAQEQQSPQEQQQEQPQQPQEDEIFQEDLDEAIDDIDTVY